MSKTQPNFSWEEIVEAGTSLFPQLMVSIINGNGSAPVAVTSFAAEDTVAEQEANQARSIGPGSALIAVILFKGTSPYGPLLDAVNTATITQDGKIDPGQNIGTDVGLVLWWHYPGDQDSAVSWVGNC